MKMELSSHRNEQITDEGLVGFNNSIVQNLQSLQAFTLSGYWYYILQYIIQIPLGRRISRVKVSSR